MAGDEAIEFEKGELGEDFLGGGTSLKGDGFDAHGFGLKKVEDLVLKW